MHNLFCRILKVLLLAVTGIPTMLCAQRQVLNYPNGMPHYVIDKFPERKEAHIAGWDSEGQKMIDTWCDMPGGEFCLRENLTVTGKENQVLLKYDPENNVLETFHQDGALKSRQTLDLKDSIWTVTDYFQSGKAMEKKVSKVRGAIRGPVLRIYTQVEKPSADFALNAGLMTQEVYYPNGQTWRKAMYTPWDHAPGGGSEVTFYQEDGKRDTTTKEFYAPGVTRPGAMELVKEGRFISYNPNGTLKEEMHLRKNKKQGIYRRWYENGNPEIEANFEDDRPLGEERLWYKNGSSQSVGYRSSGSGYDGPRLAWHENGRIKSQTCHFGGSMVFSAEYDSTGALMREEILILYLGRDTWYSHQGKMKTHEGGFSKGIRVGEWKSWWSDGEPHYTCNYDSSGYVHGELKIWTSNPPKRQGTVTFSHGWLNGPMRVVEGGVTVAEGNYVNGKPSGVWKEWKPDGTPVKEVLYDNGTSREIGRWDEKGVALVQTVTDSLMKQRVTTVAGSTHYHGSQYTTPFGWSCPSLKRVYYPNQKTEREETRTVDNPDNYEYRTYFENGNLKSHGFVVNHRHHGMAELYHENGSLSSEGRDSMDIQVGVWKYYLPDGKLKETKTFVKGVDQFTPDPHSPDYPCWRVNEKGFDGGYTGSMKSIGFSASVFNLDFHSYQLDTNFDDVYFRRSDYESWGRSCYGAVAFDDLYLYVGEERLPVCLTASRRRKNPALFTSISISRQFSGGDFDDETSQRYDGSATAFVQLVADFQPSFLACLAGHISGDADAFSRYVKKTLGVHIGADGCGLDEDSPDMDSIRSALNWEVERTRIFWEGVYEEIMLPHLGDKDFKTCVRELLDSGEDNTQIELLVSDPLMRTSLSIHDLEMRYDFPPGLLSRYDTLAKQAYLSPEKQKTAASAYELVPELRLSNDPREQVTLVHGPYSCFTPAQLGSTRIVLNTEYCMLLLSPGSEPVADVSNPSDWFPYHAVSNPQPGNQATRPDSYLSAFTGVKIIHGSLTCKGIQFEIIHTLADQHELNGVIDLRGSKLPEGWTIEQAKKMLSAEGLQILEAVSLPADSRSPKPDMGSFIFWRYSAGK